MFSGAKVFVTGLTEEIRNNNRVVQKDTDAVPLEVGLGNNSYDNM